MGNKPNKSHDRQEDSAAMFIEDLMVISAEAALPSLRPKMLTPTKLGELNQLVYDVRLGTKYHLKEKHQEVVGFIIRNLRPYDSTGMDLIVSFYSHLLKEVNTDIVSREYHDARTRMKSHAMRAKQFYELGYYATSLHEAFMAWTLGLAVLCDTAPEDYLAYWNLGRVLNRITALAACASWRLGKHRLAYHSAWMALDIATRLDTLPGATLEIDPAAVSTSSLLALVLLCKAMVTLDDASPKSLVVECALKVATDVSFVCGHDLDHDPGILNDVHEHLGEFWMAHDYRKADVIFQRAVRLQTAVSKRYEDQEQPVTLAASMASIKVHLAFALSKKYSQSTDDRVKHLLEEARGLVPKEASPTHIVFRGIHSFEQPSAAGSVSFWWDHRGYEVARDTTHVDK